MLEFYRLILVLGIIKSTVGAKVMQDAYIYASQNREGIRITYSEQPDWSDLNTVLGNHGFLGVGSVCVYGPWIAYQAPNFDASSSKDYAIVSGANRCVRPGAIQSMQPLGSAQSPFSGSITFFTEKHFGAVGYSTTSRRGRRFFDTLNGAVKSLVVVGRSQWTITDASGKSYCFATNFDTREKLPICVVPDIESTAVGKPIEIANIHKGCLKTTKPEDLISLQDCVYFGERRPDPNEKGGQSLTTSTEQDEENGEGGSGNSSKTQSVGIGADYCSGGKPSKAAEEFIMLLEIRLKHDFSSQTQLLWPTIETDVWKTEILDQTWDIAMAIVPSEIVPMEYLQMIREFMVYHLSLYWKQKGSKKEAELPEKFLRTIQHDLKQCMVLATSSSKEFYGEFMRAWLSQKKKAMFVQFQRAPEYDIVIDTTWVIANMVMATCHHVFEYTNNFWANFIHTFNTMYLLPLIDDWQGMRLEDEFILGGYDYESQYQRLAVFATTALEAVPNLEPFDRPEGLSLVKKSKSISAPITPIAVPKPKGRSMEAKFLEMNNQLPKLTYGK